MAKKKKADYSLTRNKILEEAVCIADKEGIDALSMRKLGQRLGVEAMSLYNHIANKDDLLDGIVDMVICEIELPEPNADWQEAMRLRAFSARNVFSKHPWAPMLIDSRISSGPGRLRYFETVIGTLRQAGFSIELTARAFSLIDSYIYGFGRQSISLDANEGENTEAAEAFLQALPAEEFPYLAEMATAFTLNSGYDENADFEFGLNLILDGLQSALDNSRS